MFDFVEQMMNQMNNDTIYKSSGLGDALSTAYKGSALGKLSSAISGKVDDSIRSVIPDVMEQKLMGPGRMSKKTLSDPMAMDTMNRNV